MKGHYDGKHSLPLAADMESRRRDDNNFSLIRFRFDITATRIPFRNKVKECVGLNGVRYPNITRLISNKTWTESFHERIAILLQRCINDEIIAYMKKSVFETCKHLPGICDCQKTPTNLEVRKVHQYINSNKHSRGSCKINNKSNNKKKKKQKTKKKKKTKKKQTNGSNITQTGATKIIINNEPEEKHKC